MVHRGQIKNIAALEGLTVHSESAERLIMQYASKGQISLQVHTSHGYDLTRREGERIQVTWMVFRRTFLTSHLGTQPQLCGLANQEQEV